MQTQSNNKYSANAYAKINLILKVLNKRPDNYHNIFSLVHKIGLFDTITITNATAELKEGSIAEIECHPNLGIKECDNIVYKAAEAMATSLPGKLVSQFKPAKITVNKNIPIGAGLGGGSSDAATTLCLLNKFWDLHLSYKTLHSIAADLGSDVQLFLYNSPVWVYGRGDKVSPWLDGCECNSEASTRHATIAFQPKMPASAIVVVYPNIIINTGKAYAMLNHTTCDLDINKYAEKYIAQWHSACRLVGFDANRVCDSSIPAKHATIAFQSKTSSSTNAIYNCDIPGVFENDFESVVFDSYPAIKELFELLSHISNGYARLSGSGSSVFALFSCLEAAKQARELIQTKVPADYSIFVTSFV